MPTARAVSSSPGRAARLSPEARREQIIAAARGLYAHRAYDTVSTTELAQSAGVARGLLNHYFDNKRDLYLEAMRRSVVMPDSLAQGLDGDLSQRTRGTVDRILDAATTYGQAWINASGAANLHGESDLQEVVDEADLRAAGLVLRAIGLEESPHLQARLRPVAALVKSVCREWLQRQTLSRDEAAALLTSTILLFVGEETP